MKTTLLLRLWAALRFTALCLLGLWLGATSARAQGNAFTYQGQLNSGGAPVNGSNDLTFTLFNAASGGGTVGTSNVFNDLPISNGVFTVTLDFGAGAFDGSARWVQLAVRPGASTGPYTNLNPRQPVLATPYAMRATAAGVAAAVTGNVAASQLTGTLPPATIGAGSITTTMLALGAVGSNQLATGAVTTRALAGGAVTAEKLDPTVGIWTRSGDDVFRPGGRVGIGTSTPTVPVATAALRVTGGHVVVDNNYGFLSANAANTGIGAGLDTTTNDSLNLYSAGASRVTVAATGNVGIGTASPAAKLQVNGDVRLGPGGSQFAASGEENLRIVRGRVSASGTILAGTGFGSPGWYGPPHNQFVVVFIPPFSGPPVVTVTATAVNGWATGASIKGNPDASSVGVITWVSSDSIQPVEFSFIAIGPR